MVHEVQLYAGDLVFLYSDGVTESFDEKDIEFGEERLGELLSKLRSKSVSEICCTVLRNLEDFRKGKSQPDDITMAILKVK